MAKACWLVKTEPGTYSWDQLCDDGSTRWDGVRNGQARNNLQRMKKGDRALWYHTGDERQVVAICEVSKEAYPDPTATPDEGDGWVVVDVKPVARLKTPVTLATIKATPALKDIALVRQGRLSVVPLDQAAFDTIVELGGGVAGTSKKS